MEDIDGIRIHRESVNSQGEYYCRCMDMKTSNTRWLCEVCPLCDWRSEAVSRNAGQVSEENVADSQKKVSRSGEVCCRYANSGEEFPLYWDVSMPAHGVYDEIPQKALQFAALAHKGAVRKGNGLPYIIHPMETMMITAQMTNDVEVMAAAALHDVIEDTRFIGRDIESRFGRRVAELVGMESEDKKRHRPAKDTWHERKEENLRRERFAPRDAKLIMLSDKLSNVRSTLRDFREMGSDVWNKFNMKDPEEQEWYYRAVADVVEELSDEPAYQEYLNILEIIF